MTFARRLAMGVLASAAIALVAAACAAKGGGGGGTMPEPSYERIGEDARFSRRCYAPHENRTPVCNGYLPYEPTGTGSGDAQLVQWLSDEKRWGKASKPVTRRARGGLRTSEWRVQSVTNAHKFKFSLHDSSAFVMARIVADPTAPVDSLYGIGGMQATMDSTFFLVVRGFDASDAREPRIAAEGPSRKISRWSIYGIDRSGAQPRVVKVGNEGDVRWCGHPHPGTFFNKTPPATFQFCKPSGGYIAGDSAAFLRDPPLWFTCGLGCCTGDFTM